MKSGTLLVLVALCLLCDTLCDAKPRAKDRGHHGRGGGRSRGKGRERKAPVLACSVTQNDGEEVGTEPCGDKYPDCNAASLTLAYEGENLAVTFCNRPYRPKREDVCKVTDADGTEKDESCHELKTCDEGQECIVGPFQMERRGDNVVNLYQCGVSADEKPEINYGDILRKKACESNEDCKDGATCDLKVTLNNGDELTFCQKPEDTDEDEDEETDEEDDEGHILLSLFNRRGKRNRRSSEEVEGDDSEEGNDEEDDDEEDDDEEDDDEEGNDEEDDDEEENMEPLREGCGNRRQGGHSKNSGGEGRGRGRGEGRTSGKGHERGNSRGRGRGAGRG